MISKELFSKALQNNITDEMITSIYQVMGSRNYIHYTITRGDRNDYLKINIYELAVMLKEYIEYYANSLLLSAVWIDLNDLSKDEGYYFRHCNEVYLGLKDLK